MANQEPGASERQPTSDNRAEMFDSAGEVDFSNTTPRRRRRASNDTQARTPDAPPEPSTPQAPPQARRRALEADELATDERARTPRVARAPRRSRNARPARASREGVEVPRSKIQMAAESVASAEHSERNEDAHFNNADKGIFGVFDGVGGAAAGDEASALARDSVKRLLEGVPENPSLEEATEAVKQALLEANRAVLEQQRARSNDMASTAAIGMVWKGPDGKRKAIIGNAGDSRVYRMRNGKLEQITIDDNKVRLEAGNDKRAREIQAKLNNNVNRAELSADELKFVQERNVIIQSIGMKEEDFNPSMQVIDLEPNDRLFVCSDGISDNLTDAEIEAILNANPDAQKANEALVKEAYERSTSKDPRHPRAKFDDISAMVIEIPGEGAIETPRSPSEPNPDNMNNDPVSEAFNRTPELTIQAIIEEFRNIKELGELDDRFLKAREAFMEGKEGENGLQLREAYLEAGETLQVALDAMVRKGAGLTAQERERQGFPPTFAPTVEQINDAFSHDENETFKGWEAWKKQTTAETSPDHDLESLFEQFPGESPLLKERFLKAREDYMHATKKKREKLKGTQKNIRLSPHEAKLRDVYLSTRNDLLYALTSIARPGAGFTRTEREKNERRLEDKGATVGAVLDTLIEGEQRVLGEDGFSTLHAYDSFEKTLLNDIRKRDKDVKGEKNKELKQLANRDFIERGDDLDALAKTVITKREEYKNKILERRLPPGKKGMVDPMRVGLRKNPGFFSWIEDIFGRRSRRKS